MESEFSPVLSVPYVNFITWEKAVVRRFQSNRFVFAVETPSDHRKVFQVFFNKKDGTLNVNFPYFKFTEGIAAVASFPPFLDQANINLENTGKITSKKVKYAHKPDGQVHFSQDAKVVTRVVKRSAPLKEYDGHIFSLHIHGLSKFEDVHPDNDKLPPSQNRTVLNFRFEKETTSGIKFVGRWYETKNFLKDHRGGEYGPSVPLEDPQGNRSKGFLIGPLKGSPMEDFLLLVSCLEHPKLDESLDAELFFIGGFDSQSAIINPDKRHFFLCLHYPASNYNELITRLESIDFDQDRDDIGLNE
jgi:hypothetical protein